MMRRQPYRLHGMLIAPCARRKAKHFTEHSKTQMAKANGIDIQVSVSAGGSGRLVR